VVSSFTGSIKSWPLPKYLVKLYIWYVVSKKQGWLDLPLWLNLPRWRLSLYLLRTHRVLNALTRTHCRAVEDSKAQRIMGIFSESWVQVGGCRLSAVL
jgi:hypothetical protein